MMSKTHMLISITVTSFALETINPIVLGTAALASQLPDVDTSTSSVGRILLPLSRWIERRFPHRTLTHSFLATAIIATLAVPLRWRDAQLWHALILGYFCGWFSDAFTKSGVAAFYPLSSARLVIPANPRLRLTTGSRAEYVVCAALLLSLFASFQLHTQGGLRRTFNALLAQPEGVTALFAKASATHQILAHIEGRFIASATSVNAEFAVLEVEGERLLVRDANGLLYWAAQESACTHCHLAIHRVQARLGARMVMETKEVRWQEKELGEVAGEEKAEVGTRNSKRETRRPPTTDHRPPFSSLVNSSCAMPKGCACRRRCNISTQSKSLAIPTNGHAIARCACGARRSRICNRS